MAGREGRSDYFGSKPASECGLKTRHPEIPWAKVAGIGSVLRHDYERIAPDVIWKLATVDLPFLDAACRDELARG